MSELILLNNDDLIDMRIVGFDASKDNVEAVYSEVYFLKAVDFEKRNMPEKAAEALQCALDCEDLAKS